MLSPLVGYLVLLCVFNSDWLVSMSGAHKDASKLLPTCLSVQELFGDGIPGRALCQTCWRSKGMVSDFSFAAVIKVPSKGLLKCNKKL